MQIVALIHDTGGTYAVSFPDFPGCMVEADDADAVILRAAETLALHIERMIEDGRELPQIRPLARLASDPAFLVSSAGRMIALIPYGPTTRPVRLTITLDEALLSRLDRAAQAAGETRSAYLAEAARQRLAHDASTGREPAPHLPSARTERPAARTVPDALDASVAAASTDAAASLASIRDMLERLDPSIAPGNQPPLLRPARRNVL